MVRNSVRMLAVLAAIVWGLCAGALAEGRVLVADCTGGGDYISVTAAVEAAQDGDVVLVMPGVYEDECVRAWGKRISIIGVDRETCILESCVSDYMAPPVEMCAGVLMNLTIRSLYDGEHRAKFASYAVHCEHDGLAGQAFVIAHCDLYSELTAALGMGLRAGCHVLLRDVTLRNGPQAEQAALYIHDHEAGTVPRGRQTVRVEACRMEGGGEGIHGITLQSQEKPGARVYITFRDCQASTICFFNYLGSVSESALDFGGLINWRLASDSSGNSLAQMNAGRQ